MISLRRSADCGHADHGWLKSQHTFSFADYFDPAWVHFGLLRVVNQDEVAPGQGFGTHGHQDMEIVSYVLEGVLEHKDSLGNGSQVRPGEVQIMSAGTGVTHSEFIASPDGALRFLQMWVFPRAKGTQPRYEQRDFPSSERRGRLRLVVDPDGAEGAVTIGQDARLRAGSFDGPESFELALPADRSAWLHVARGSLRLNGEVLGAGDGAGIRDEPLLKLDGGEGAEVVLWELPK